MGETKPTARPLSPHLQIYRPMLTMMMSIVHRITGAGLYFGILLLVWWLLAAARLDRHFDHGAGLLRPLVRQARALRLHLGADPSCAGRLAPSVLGYGPGFELKTIEWLARANLARFDRPDPRAVARRLSAWGHEHENTARARAGLGSAKAGTEHWWLQRVTAIANMPLVMFLIVFVVMHLGVDRAELIASVSIRSSPSLLALAFLSILWHMRLGMQVIIEDYVHGPARQLPAFSPISSSRRSRHRRPLCDPHHELRSLSMAADRNQRPPRRKASPSAAAPIRSSIIAFDVLVVGAGGSGLRATLGASPGGPQDRLHHQGLPDPLAHGGGARRHRRLARQYGTRRLALAHV